MAKSTDTKVSEFIINVTTEELLKNQTIEPNQIYVTPASEEDTTSHLTVDDIIDNLTTQDSTKVLSANQGYVLNNLISTVKEDETLIRTTDTLILDGGTSEVS